MTTRVVVLNGGSSAGKSAIARRLQDLLPELWLSLGVDTLVDALPAALRTAESGIVFAADGGVSVGDQFRALEAAWMAGVATMARAGVGVIIDDVFLSGPASQRRWQDALAGLDVLWVGVRCDADVAAAREAARGDRAAGMAAAQADLVHEGVQYDVTVDTTHADPLSCAQVIAAVVR